MNKHRRILAILHHIRDTHPMMAEFYKSGGCYDLFELLHLIYPEAKPRLDDSSHVVTEIDGKMYDINGVVHGKNFVPLKEIKTITQIKRTGRKW